MNARQTRFYVWAVDIWRQSDTPSGTDFGKFTKLASSVACLFASKREAVEAGLGREQSLSPLDHFDFDLSVDVRDTDMLHMVSGPSDVGRWFAVSGGPARAAFRAGRQRVLAKASVKPDGAP